MKDRLRFFTIRWIDQKIQIVALEAYTEDEAVLSLVDKPLIKVGFLENRPTDEFGQIVPMWLDIDPSNILTVHRTELYS